MQQKAPSFFREKKFWGTLPKGPPGKETRFPQRQRGFKGKNNNKEHHQKTNKQKTLKPPQKPVILLKTMSTLKIISSSEGARSCALQPPVPIPAGPEPPPSRPPLLPPPAPASPHDPPPDLSSRPPGTYQLLPDPPPHPRRRGSRPPRRGPPLGCHRSLRCRRLRPAARRGSSPWHGGPTPIRSGAAPPAPRAAAVAAAAAPRPPSQGRR